MYENIFFRWISTTCMFFRTDKVSRWNSTACMFFVLTMSPGGLALHAYFSY